MLGGITEFRDEMSTATVPQGTTRPARLSLELSQQVRAVPPAPLPGRTPPAVVAYVTLVAIAAIVVAGVIAEYGPSVETPQLIVAAVLAGFTLAAELLSYRKPTGGSGSVGHIPLLALALVVPAWPAVVAAGLPFLVVAIVHKRPVLRAVFNATQIALAVGAASIVFLAMGGAPLETLPRNALWQPRIAFATLVADAAFVLVNTSAVSAVLALTTKRRFLEVWRASTLSTIAYYFFCVPVSGGLAWMVVHGGLVAAGAITLPMLGVRQLYQTTFQLVRTTQEFLELMVSAIEARDEYTSGHSRRVAAMAVVVARAVGLSDRAVERIRVAGLLHDVGKIHEKYAAILQKPDRLGQQEWLLMQQHPMDGVALVSKVSQLQDIVPGVRHHHEKWDGTGYPDRLAGESIPLMARILAVADTIDAMSSDRPYRPGLTRDEVYAELKKWSGRQFDPAIIEKLLDTPHWDELFDAADTIGWRPANTVPKETAPPRPLLVS